MKYYEVICSTPYVGEEGIYCCKVNDETEIKRVAVDLMYENGYEWYDEEVAEVFPTEEEYFDRCSYVIKEITKEEYEENCPWDKED